MNKVKLDNIKLSGETGILAENIIDNWLVGLRETNPAILDMFYDRDVRPYRNMLPWSGEFAGKYITGAYYIYQLTYNKKLYDYILAFIDELISTQAKNGYLGCFSEECQLTGAYSQNPDKAGNTWDSWSHYHIMYGLLLWYDETGNNKYLEAVEKAAALFINTFYNGKKTLVSIGSTEMNLSVYHVFGILYRLTKNHAYLDFALNVEHDMSHETAGDYINYSLQGYEYYQCRNPRWESMHDIMGIAEMYRCTGKDMYLGVAMQIFKSILKTDVHNTGGFSTEEQAIGHPYKNAPIETCCVVAYNALGAELYSLTGDPEIADFLEFSHYNAVLGTYSPTGRWSTYNSPMEGDRLSNFHWINFQSRAGSPELNCCSVNAPRGVGEVSEWLLAEAGNTIYLNFYEDADYHTSSGISIRVTGGYPAFSTVKLSIKSPAKQKLAFRIPAWSVNTKISCAGEEYFPQAGKYFSLNRTWNDEVTIIFDFTPRFGNGDFDYAGKSSVYIGPVLYGVDASHNRGFMLDQIPPIKRSDITSAIPQKSGDGSIAFSAGGITFTDFYHLGVTGCMYRTWFEITD